MNFKDFQASVAKQFQRMATGDLFRVDATKDELWTTYLSSYPEGSNPIFRERTKHDCNCCKQFIRTVGNVVAFIDGKLVTIWDGAVSDPNYAAVSAGMAALIRSKKVVDVFLHYEPTAGREKNFEESLKGTLTWNHFFVNIPPQFVTRKDTIPTKLGEQRALHDVLFRSLAEITDDAVDTVLELIAQNSLYRGEEHKFAVTEFKKVHAQLDNALNVDQFVWQMSKVLPASVSKIRNTSIGTLLVALSEGKDLEDAVKSFEAMVAPSNYKRPTALVTKAMIDKAKATIEELGLTSALSRRYAKLDDITINNILYANRSTRAALEGDVFDALSASVGDKAPKNLDKIEEVSIEKFLKDILPKAESIEVMMDNQHTGNLVSLIAPVDPTAKQLFKWGNAFSWSYNGEMADSIKERVKQAGGNVTGDVCCRLAWEYTDDLDFHMYEPGGSKIYFGNRSDKSPNGGRLDVDANGGSGMMAHPVENIFYQSASTMKPGDYILKVHNYTRRSSGVGFEVEIDIKGIVHHLVYDKVIKQGEFVTVATLRVNNNGQIDVIPVIQSTTSVKQVWGVSTNTFQPVNVVMMSPNYWDDKAVGNKHYFFMLDGCKNEDKARGFFNEFLKPELDVHRKVLEMVGSKMKTDEAVDQLSGLGFSSTQRNKLLCRVKGSFSRIINIVF